MKNNNNVLQEEYDLIEDSLLKVLSQIDSTLAQKDEDQIFVIKDMIKQIKNENKDMNMKLNISNHLLTNIKYNSNTQYQLKRRTHRKNDKDDKDID